jgi:hypothetical protein
MAKDIGNTKIRVYDVSVGGADIGYCTVDSVQVAKTLKEIKLPHHMGQVMGHRLIGVAATVKVTFSEITRANLAKAFPWYAGTTEVIPLAPTALGVDLYTLAVAITLHPVDKAGLLDEDIVLTKAVCVGPLDLKTDGESDAGITLEFYAYPDRAQLPNIVIGSIPVVAA